MQSNRNSNSELEVRESYLCFSRLNGEDRVDPFGFCPSSFFLNGDRASCGNESPTRCRGVASRGRPAQ